MIIPLNPALLYFLTLLFAFLFANMVFVCILLVRRIKHPPEPADYQKLVTTMQALSKRLEELEAENHDLKQRQMP